MDIYKKLDNKIKAISKSTHEYNQYKELVLKHFEGKDVFRTMTFDLQNAIAEWENDVQADKSKKI